MRFQSIEDLGSLLREIKIEAQRLVDEADRFTTGRIIVRDES